MNDIKTISIDIETFSDIDLSKCGVYKYTESENFEILLFAYSINHGEVQVVDLAVGEKIPMEIIKALVDNKILKWAYNANFERVCLSRYISRYYPDIFIFLWIILPATTFIVSVVIGKIFWGKENGRLSFSLE